MRDGPHAVACINHYPPATELCANNSENKKMNLKILSAALTIQFLTINFAWAQISESNPRLPIGIFIAKNTRIDGLEINGARFRGSGNFLDNEGSLYGLRINGVTEDASGGPLLYINSMHIGPTSTVSSIDPNIKSSSHLVATISKNQELRVDKTFNTVLDIEIIPPYKITIIAICVKAKSVIDLRIHTFNTTGSGSKDANQNRICAFIERPHGHIIATYRQTRKDENVYVNLDSR